jgi:hypothetical protein
VYVAPGPSYEALAQMYDGDVAAYKHASSFNISPSFSIYGLYDALRKVEEAGRLAASFDDDEIGMRDLENGIDGAIELAK